MVLINSSHKLENNNITIDVDIQIPNRGKWSSIEAKTRIRAGSNAT
jgi:hypothetical protein